MLSQAPLFRYSMTCLPMTWNPARCSPFVAPPAPQNKSRTSGFTPGILRYSRQRSAPAHPVDQENLLRHKRPKYHLFPP